MDTPLPTSERRALVAEDDGELRALVVDALIGEGFVVHDVGDGRRMWRRTFEPTVYHLVVADVRLPIVDGLTVLEDLRTRAPRARFVVTTAAPDDAARRRAAGIGAVLLVKPFGMDALRAAVRHLLEPAAHRGRS